ncbi:general substrate transporter [Dothidotthia symphoricarpi CBS 119687]|uniref:General substrate transporter n=1 Tax=Dothidotthia symphoricarpi CBS 119687 TaxID=1392245 RepID=A0A6A6A7A7_9PLEO|nr:general substrate transporter [Dothidotthia symphoricarpi CBS 119687]KAF2126521.1 general substrate transporter [Dothidotthia symphoricarpi CBS 119687]
MVKNIFKPKMGAVASKGADVEIAQAEAPHLTPVHWRSDPGLRKLYFYAVIICIASATTGYDGSMLNNLRILKYWTDYFHDPKESTLGLLTALYSIGSIASLPIAPLIADRYGRRAAIVVGCVIMIVGAAIQGAAKNLSYFMGGRFLMGFGNSLAQLSSPLLLTELCHPQHRARVTAVYNCLWNVGAIICTWLTFGTKRIDSDWCWRIPALTQAAPSIIQLSFIWFIPESPRWLISKERNEEALAILGKYHANGDINNPTVQFEYAEIKETLRLEFLYKKTSSYLDFFKTRGNRYRLMLLASLGLFSQWSGNGLVSYYATDVYKSIGITDADTQLGLNGGQTILSLIVSVSCALLIDRVGRRPLFIAATASMCGVFVVWTICSSQQEATKSKAAGSGVIAMIWLFNIAYALAWSGLLVAYTVEILPFKIRAKGLMIMNLFIQVALTINQYVNPYGFEYLKPTWKFYTIYAVWIFIELIFVCVFYVETRGPTLEEVAKIFDGEDAEVARVDIDEVTATVSGFEKNEGMHVEHAKL